MTTQGQRQEKAMLMTRVEKYKLEEEMAVLSSSVWMAMLYCLCENGECRMIILRGNGGGMVELGDVKKRKKVKMKSKLKSDKSGEIQT